MTNKVPPCAIKGHCIHYTGIYGPGLKKIECCEAGVNYSELTGDKDVKLYKLPCCPPFGKHSASDQVPCEKKQLPTDEQVAAYDAWVDERLKLHHKALKLCREDAKGRWGIIGHITCPACGNKLHYSVASVNGHLWGQCETEDCLHWMQ